MHLCVSLHDNVPALCSEKQLNESLEVQHDLFWTEFALAIDPIDEGYGNLRNCHIIFSCPDNNLHLKGIARASNPRQDLL